MIKLADENAPLTKAIIKEIHSLVMMHETEIKGVYRSLPVTIRGAIQGLLRLKLSCAIQEKIKSP
ncbi:MAG: hypothetical protein FWC66_05845 [Oscillospiraceae bacterium]|nr:hypothetical protein [Oscillospiraceae bacterium]